MCSVYTFHYMHVHPNTSLMILHACRCDGFLSIPTSTSAISSRYVNVCDIHSCMRTYLALQCFKRMCMWSYVLFSCICAYIYIYIYTRAYIHIYIHTLICACFYIFPSPKNVYFSSWVQPSKIYDFAHKTCVNMHATTHKFKYHCTYLYTQTPLCITRSASTHVQTDFSNFQLPEKNEYFRVRKHTYIT
jgi:hypothetical protein